MRKSQGFVDVCIGRVFAVEDHADLRGRALRMSAANKRDSRSMDPARARRPSFRGKNLCSAFFLECSAMIRFFSRRATGEPRADLVSPTANRNAAAICSFPTSHAELYLLCEMNRERYQTLT